MPIAGLQLTLDPNPELAADAIGALRSRTEIEMGTPRGQALPVMTDVDGTRESSALHQWIASLPGIAHVDLVYAAPEHDSTSSRMTPAKALSLDPFHAN